MTVGNWYSSTSTSTPRACLHVMGHGLVDVDELWHLPVVTQSNQVEGANPMITNGSPRATTARNIVSHPPERR